MAASTEELAAVVDLRLLADADRAYQLPGDGSRSLLYVFDGQQIGAMAVTADGRDLVPASEHYRAVLTFWADEARVLVTTGSRFSVWYGGTVSDGIVRSVGWNHD